MNPPPRAGRKDDTAVIRSMREDDIPAVLAIYNDAILHTTAIYRYEPVTEQERREWFGAHRRAGYPLLVEEEQGRAVGFATFGPFRPYPAYKYTVEHSVYVDAAFRRRGVGRRLMEELLRLASDSYAVMVAGIDAENTGSIRLHEQLGFRFAGTIPRAGFKFGRWLDLVFYQLALAGPAHPTDG